MTATEVQHTYRLFGLVVGTPTPLAAESTRDQPDVKFFPAPHPLFPTLPKAAHSLFSVHVEANRTLIEWAQCVQFIISGDGAAVEFYSGEITADAVMDNLLPQILSFVLLHRGVETLHATALVRDGEAVALLGESGHGKSTLAAAMMMRGWKLLTDDVVAFNGELALRGMHRIKLTPAVAEATIGIRPGTPIDDERGKWIYSLSASEVHTSPAPLKRIFVIAPNADELDFRDLRGVQAFQALAAATFNPFGQSQLRLRNHMEFLNELVRRVRITEIKIPRRLDLLSGAAGLVTT